MLLNFSQWLAFTVLRLAPGSLIGDTVQFFFYDVIKINGLLFALIFAIGVVRSFIVFERLKRWMGRPGLTGCFVAALFGAVTPFCSCSSIPIFLSFLRAGASLGVMFAFLITSPLINEYLVVLMLGLFGWKITAAYVVSGMLIGMVSGLVLGRMKLERHLVADIVPAADGVSDLPVFQGWRSRILYGWQESVSIICKVWLWVVVGVALGAVIHNYVPQALIDRILSATGIFSVPLAVLIGVPMYGSCAAIVPVAVALFQKGVPLGTSLAFMMAISALSLPEAIMLRRAMKLPLIAVFFGITTVAIIITGYLINGLQPFLVN